MGENYIYANMRIKHIESLMLTVNDFESMLSMNSCVEALSYLKSRSWYAGDESSSIDSILKQKEVDLWNFVKEIVSDTSFFSAILLKKDFMNLKLALRGVLSNIDVSYLLDPFAFIKTDILLDCVASQSFSSLPYYISSVAKESFGKLLQTGDACLCDAIVDAGMFKAMNVFNKKRGLKIAQDYVELLAVYSNISICIRSIKLNKNCKSFLSAALIPCKTFDLNNLLCFTIKGIDSLVAYLNSVNYLVVPPFIYSDGVDSLGCWFDASLYSLVKKERKCCFTLSPIFAFILANYLQFKHIRLVFNCFVTGESREDLLSKFRFVLS